MGKNGEARRSGEPADEAPRSRAKEIAARGDDPSAANLGRLVHAGIVDVLLGGLDRRDAAAMFSGVRAFVGLARNREPVDGLCEEMLGQAERPEQIEARALRRRLAEIEAATCER